VAGESPFVKPFQCPACGAPQTIRALGRTTEYSCDRCGSIIDITNEPYAVLHAATEAPAISPLIPLGRRGTLGGIKYECIGFMVRSDPTGDYPWHEYLLFNPYHGFRWLMTMNGHWNFITPVFGNVEPPFRGPLQYEGRSYRIFLRDSAVVRFVQGEFYWQVKVGDNVVVREYISPPYTFSLELDDDERNFAHAEYIPSATVQQAFALEPRSLPPPQGVFPNQPSPYPRDRAFYLLGTILTLTFLVVTALLFRQPTEPVTVVRGSIATSAARLITTETFEFTNHGNLRFTLESPVSNSWVDAEIDIVNADTGASTDTTVGVSYYYGYEGGEHWTEGSTTEATTVGDIPTGRYYFTIQTTGAATGTTASLPYTVTVDRHAFYPGNLVLALALTALPLAVNLLGGMRFESRRWSTSTEVSTDNSDD